MAEIEKRENRRFHLTMFAVTALASLKIIALLKEPVLISITQC
jgi:hypothetical protein